MPRFQLIEVPGVRLSEAWTIEQITPGERPVPVDFYGRKADVEAEIHRLNAGGEVRQRMPARAGQSKRPRNKGAI